MSLEDKKLYEDILSGWTTPPGLSEEDAWTGIQHKIAAQKPVKQLRVRTLVWSGLSAAAAALLFFLWLGAGSGEVIRHETLSGITEFDLPDGSRVHLNAGSVITYSSGDWEDQREIELSGQAFFEVKKGRTFTVKTDKGRVEVLGTSFDVFARDEAFRVQCKTGKVEVISGGSKNTLTAGQCTHLDGKKLCEVHTGHAIGGDWWKGAFYWEDAPLEEVFREIERQYGIKIQHPDLSDRRYSGGFEKGELIDVLNLVCLPMGLRFETLTGGAVRIFPA